MYSQSIVGMPRRCVNRLCRAVFYLESHLGWIEKSEMEVYAVMRCPKCRDTFAVVQPISIVHEYREKLPRDPKNKATSSGPISLSEIDKMRKSLESKNILSSLSKGAKPGYSDFSPSEE